MTETTKRPVTWTDVELEKAWNAAYENAKWSGSKVRWSDLDPNSIAWHRAFAEALGVHPTEAREREREAWREGGAACLAARMDSHSPYAKKVLNACYPSLLPETPPPLVLSTGVFLRNDGKWIARFPCVGAFSAPPINTASDANKLAAWLREYGNTEERE